MAYFQTKDGSLEESIRKAVGGIQEKVEYVEYKFKNKNDAMKAKKMLDAVQLMNFDINDDNINGGELMVDAGNKDMTKYHQEIIKKFRPKVMTTEKLVGGQKKLDKDKDGDIDGKDFAMLRKSAAKKKNVKEGTWAMPDTPKLKMGLKKALQRPIMLGKEGDDATDTIRSFIGDDELYDDLYAAGMKNPKGDARPIIKKAMKRLGI